MSFGSYILNAVRDDRAYGEMLKAAQARLQGRNAADVAQRSGFAWNTETNTLSCASLGRVVTVEAADWSIHGALGNWHALTVLHYLDMADASPLWGELITFAQQRDGLARGGDFDRRAEIRLSATLGRLTPAEVETRCRTLGGTRLRSNADLCVRFDYLPRYPVTLKLWFADEELEGSGRLFLDRSCDRYLTIEDAVTVGTILLEELTKA